MSRARLAATGCLAIFVGLTLAIAVDDAAAQMERAPEPRLVADGDPGEGPTSSASEGEADPAALADRPPVFVPPSTDKPVTRLRSASSRSAGRGLRLDALAPERPGRTVSAHPSLFWHLDRAPRSDARVLFTLTSETREEPVAELALATPSRPGIQRIRLEELGITLEPHVLYEWSVELVLDPERRSRSVYALGGLERVDAPDSLATRLAGRSPSSHPHVYAEFGLWYDALASVSDMIDAAPGDPVPRGVRTSLLRQVGLDGIGTD